MFQFVFFVCFFRRVSDPAGTVRHVEITWRVMEELLDGFSGGPERWYPREGRVADLAPPDRQ